MIEPRLAPDAFTNGTGAIDLSVLRMVGAGEWVGRMRPEDWLVLEQCKARASPSIPIQVTRAGGPAAEPSFGRAEFVPLRRTAPAVVSLWRDDADDDDLDDQVGAAGAVHFAVDAWSLRRRRRPWVARGSRAGGDLLWNIRQSVSTVRRRAFVCMGVMVLLGHIERPEEAWESISRRLGRSLRARDPLVIRKF